MPLTKEQEQRLLNSVRQTVAPDFTQQETPTPIPQPQQQEQTFLQKLGQGAAGFGRGVGKSALSLFRGAASLGERGLEATLGRIPGVTTQEQRRAPTGAEQLISEEAITPVGAAEKAGKITGDIAQFFAPGGLPGRVAKGIGGGSKLFQLLGRAGTEAATLGGITTLQEGKFGKETQTATILGASIPIAGKVIKQPFKIFKNIPATIWNKILKAIPTEAQKSPKLGRELAKEKIIAGSKEAISRKASTIIQDIELSIASILEKKTGTVSTEKVVERLGIMKRAYENIPGESSSVQTIESIGKELLAKGKSIPVKEANQIKRDIYKVLSKSYGKGLLEIPAKTETQKQIARGLKEEIERVIPDIKSLNARQAVFLQTKKILDRTIARESKNRIFGLTDVIVGTGGVGAGAVLGNPLAGLGILFGKKVIESTAFKSTVSAGIQNMIGFYNKLSPTQKVLLYSALRGTVAELNQKTKK